MKPTRPGIYKCNQQVRISLKEMAQRLNRCPKTFRKYVIEYQIPHICLGRDMLFNAVEVEDFLTALTLKNQSYIQQYEKPNSKQSRPKQNLKKLDQSKIAMLRCWV
jgi:hypothetical protein